MVMLIILFKVKPAVIQTFFYTPQVYHIQFLKCKNNGKYKTYQTSFKSCKKPTQHSKRTNHLIFVLISLCAFSFINI